MEDSIRRAEELIEATNTALARIQYDASLDDFSNLLQDVKQRETGKALVLDDVRRVLSPRGKLLEADNPLSLNKSPVRGDNIEEIKYKTEIFRPEKNSPKVSVVKATSDTNLSQRTVNMKLMEDLKAKLQATQEVVSRGIQTAKELNETVEVLKSVRQSKTDVQEVQISPHKSESVNSIRTTDTKRCKRCNTELPRRAARQKVRRKEDNVLVTRVTGTDSSTPRRRHNLNYQQLPSLKIQGDLRCQRIPSIDIPPGKEECLPQRANAAYEMYSHEDLLNGKVDKILQQIKESNGFLRTEDSNKKKSVECSKCGRVVRMSNESVRTEQIDELLKMCDYNVYDPRIDEFAERYNARIPEEVKWTQTEEEPVHPVKTPPKEIVKRRMRISDLSNEVTRKYRENATELENEHLEFEGILRELFEKMDESRSVLKKCDYLNTIAGKRKSSLSVTPPVLLSYTGSGEEADDGMNAVLRPNRTQRNKLSKRLIRKKLERKELEVNCKMISSSCPGPVLPDAPPKAVKPSPIIKRVSDMATVQIFPHTSIEENYGDTPEENERTTVKPPSPAITAPDPAPNPKPEDNVNTVEGSVKQTNAETDYESDFEEESIPDKSPEPQADENSFKYNSRLSTISEADSELDRKMSELAIAPEESNNGRVEEKKPSGSSSSEEDDTRKLLRQVNRDLEEVASQQLMSTKRSETMKKVPEEVAEPLKEVLNALKEQFERTELLADKLTESIKEVKKPEEGQETVISNGHRDFVMVNNLQRARKIVEDGNCSKSFVLSTLREKSTRLREIPLSPPGSVGSKESISSGRSYSEGEISEQEVLPLERSSPSIGEVINEHSDGSISEEKSVFSFL